MILLISEGQRFPELVSFYHTEIVSHGLEGMRAVIRRGVERGEFRESGLSEFPMLLMVPVIGSVIWNHLFGTKEALDVQVALETHMDIMLAGLRP